MTTLESHRILVAGGAGHVRDIWISVTQRAGCRHHSELRMTRVWLLAGIATPATALPNRRVQQLLDGPRRPLLGPTRAH